MNLRRKKIKMTNPLHLAKLSGKSYQVNEE
jgi:hypothetical protein